MARAARALLDQNGRSETRILVSGDLDPERVRALAKEEAPIDGYGVGTNLVTCPEAPTCDLVYKLVERIHQGRILPRMKISGDKASFPLRKELYRLREGGGLGGDLLAAEGETAPDGLSSLLVRYVEAGETRGDLPDIHQIRDYARTQLDGLPARLWKLEGDPYPVHFSPRLREAERALRPVPPLNCPGTPGPSRAAPRLAVRRLAAVDGRLTEEPKRSSGERILQVVDHLADSRVDDHLAAGQAGRVRRIENAPIDAHAMVGRLGDGILLGMGAEAVPQLRTTVRQPGTAGTAPLETVSGAARRAVVACGDHP